MTLFAQTSGQRNVEIISLTDTSEADLIVSSASSTSTLESLIACNTTDAGLKLDVIYEKNGVSVYVLHEVDVPVGDVYHLKDHNLSIPAGCVLRVRSSAPGMDVTAIHVRNHAGMKSQIDQ